MKSLEAERLPTYPGTCIHVRTSAGRPLIIEQPRRQPPLPRFLFGSTTLAIWSLWVYLWNPLVNLLFWLLGFEFAYDQLYLEGGLSGLKEKVGYYLLALTFTAGGLMLWATINLLRFRGVERRKPRAQADTQQIAQSFGRSHEEIRLWKSSRSMEAHFDEHGHLSRMTYADAVPRP